VYRISVNRIYRISDPNPIHNHRLVVNGVNLIHHTNRLQHPLVPVIAFRKLPATIKGLPHQGILWPDPRQTISPGLSSFVCFSPAFQVPAADLKDVMQALSVTDRDSPVTSKYSYLFVFCSSHTCYSKYALHYHPVPGRSPCGY
jgi:hypothetical protein